MVLKKQDLMVLYGRVALKPCSADLFSRSAAFSWSEGFPAVESRGATGLRKQGIKLAGQQAKLRILGANAYGRILPDSPENRSRRRPRPRNRP